MAKKVFRVDLGNSNTGPVGMVARVEADTPEEALERIKSLIDDNAEDGNTVTVYDRGPDYVNVYLNSGAITLADIEEEEDGQ